MAPDCWRLPPVLLPDGEQRDLWVADGVFAVHPIDGAESLPDAVTPTQPQAAGMPLSLRVIALVLCLVGVWRVACADLMSVLRKPFRAP